MPDDINVAATREIAARTNNLFLPIYNDPEQTSRKFEADDPEREALDAAFGRASGQYDENNEDQATLDIFLCLADHVSELKLISVHHDPSTADFHWSRMRCLFGGVGFKHHHKIATLLSSLYPMCAMRPDETIEEWRTALAEAHRLCGWPVSLGLVPWAELRFAIQFAPKDSIFIHDWHKIVAYIHLLKHLRFSRIHGLVVTYEGKAIFVDAPDGTNLCTKRHLDMLGPALGLPPNRGKLAHPLAVAVNNLLKSLPVSNYLERQSLANVPGFVLAGPWSRLMPDPQSMHGFVQHGMRLTNVWMAENGKVELVPGGTEEIIGFDWNLKPGTADVEAKMRYIASLPKTYDTYARPSDIFLHAFPNTSFERYRLFQPAFKAVFDSILCAGLMRVECPSLQREKPFILFMPADPQPEDATNQGKTYAADVVANAFVPGIGRADAVPTSTSAPDMRALAADVEHYGTLNIDEWVMPQSGQHFLCHKNLQSLLVGGAVKMGKTFENESFPVTLKYPLIANTKVFYVPPDLVNRCFPVFMETFTDEQRSRADVLHEVEAGVVSVRLRLAALGMIERLGLVDYVNDGRFGTTNSGSRYSNIRAMAIRILRQRDGLPDVEATLAIDSFMESCRKAIGAHTREAESSGLLAQQMDGDGVVVRAYAVFSEIGPMRIEELVQVARQESPDGGAHGLSPTAILRGRLTIAGSTNSNLGTLLTFIGGRTRNVSDRVMSLAFARDLKALMPQVGAEWLLPDICGERGWKMTRMSDNSGAIRVRIEQDAPATHRTLPPE